MSPILNPLSLKRFTADEIIRRVSVAADGAEADGSSFYSGSISADGRYVVFVSSAGNLAGDPNGNAQVFRKDLLSGAVTLVSTSADGVPGDSASYNPQLSADGRYVLFESHGDGLVPADTNGKTDVFLKDMATGAIERVAVGLSGAEADGSSYRARFSPDGRFVVFESNAGNLVAGDTNNDYDIFRKNLAAGAIERISVASDGSQGSHGSSDPEISADGRYIVFESDAANLVQGDSTLTRDVFRKDLVTGAVVLVSTAADGSQTDAGSSDAHISIDGRYVVFTSDATNLVSGDTNDTYDIFRKDLLTGAVVRVSTARDGSQADEASFLGQISPDGRYVIFESSASNLVAGDANNAEDIFRKDLVTGEIVRLSGGPDGADGNGSSNWPQIGVDGRYLLFSSSATNLVAGDTNNHADVFLTDLDLASHRTAVREGRYVEASFSVGSASSVTIAWGDGAADTATPSGSRVSFRHEYASAAGSKAALVTVAEGAQTWVVPYRIDVPTNAMNRDTSLSDTLTGGAGSDTLTGDDFANTIVGLSGNDRIIGALGHDKLTGGAQNDILRGDRGNDTISGGEGRDTIYLSTSSKAGFKDKDVVLFDTSLKNSKSLANKHKDTIYGFEARKKDQVWIDGDVFRNKDILTLDKVGRDVKAQKVKKAWVAFDKAKDANDYFVIKKAGKKAKLYFDADGSGRKALVELGTFSFDSKTDKTAKFFDWADLMII